MNDPGFIAEAKKQHLDIQEVDGRSVVKFVEHSYSQPPEVVTAVHEAMGLTGYVRREVIMPASGQETTLCASNGFRQ